MLTLGLLRCPVVSSKGIAAGLPAATSLRPCYLTLLKIILLPCSCPPLSTQGPSAPSTSPFIAMAGPNSCQPAANPAHGKQLGSSSSLGCPQPINTMDGMLGCAIDGIQGCAMDGIEGCAMEGMQGVITATAAAVSGSTRVGAGGFKAGFWQGDSSVGWQLSSAPASRPRSRASTASCVLQTEKLPERIPPDAPRGISCWGWV